ncbi:MAG: sensor histidine kinase [Ktedonobacterales bacterium]
MSRLRRLTRASSHMRSRRALPLRLWLVLAVVAITGAGFVAQVTLTAVMSVWEQQVEDARLTSVRQIIGTDAAHWRNPAWQRQADASLAALGVDVALYATRPEPSGQPGQASYVTAGAYKFLGASGKDASGATANQPSAETQPDMSARVVFQRIVIENQTQSVTYSPVGVALLWDTRPAPGEMLGFVWPAVELGAFALTLAIVLWLIGQPVLRPLAAMSQAAEDIAGGDLDVHLPLTPVREIAAVGAALEGMSAALRQSLDQQSTLEEERRLFVGAIAHDLRTPLFMLRGHLKGLERGVVATPEKVAHYIAMCQAKADALERLIADLFAYTRLEYLEQTLERAPLELGELLSQAVEGARPLAVAKGITLTLNGPNEPCPLVGDGHLLTRAIENLLDNALRHTPKGGTIRARWSQARDAVFTVEDTGLGIPAHEMPHLFTPLYRGESSRNRQTGGAGLGLAISRRILRAHGGDLTAANVPQRGAVFTGTLPAPRRETAPIRSSVDTAMV